MMRVDKVGFKIRLFVRDSRLWLCLPRRMPLAPAKKIDQAALKKLANYTNPR
jgi:hypothetical protein